jgi:uncharacterized SAM-binding protein YcdF (DUF218 family)
MSAKIDRRCFGIFVRRERWSLSFKGLSVAFLMLLLCLILFHQSAYPFLATTKRVPAETLVVQGWTPIFTLQQTTAEFRAGHYKNVLVVRAVEDKADVYESGRFMADYVAQTLIEHGIPSDRVHTVFCSTVKKDRTYHSALAAKKWLVEHQQSSNSINVITAGPHARRSRLLFKKAFGKGTAVGIIALEPIAYDTRRWWRSSEGVRDVFGESLAYLYARFVFSP